MSMEKPISDPEIVLLYCRHCVREDAEVTLAAQDAAGFSVRLSLVPCSSKIEVFHILKLLEQGADGVEVVACPEGRCRSLVGSVRAEKRVGYARRLLEEVRMGTERVGISRRAGLSACDLMALAGNRAKIVRALGPHPMKKGMRR